MIEDMKKYEDAMNELIRTRCKVDKVEHEQYGLYGNDYASQPEMIVAWDSRHNAMKSWFKLSKKIDATLLMRDYLLDN